MSTTTAPPARAPRIRKARPAVQGFTNGVRRALVFASLVSISQAVTILPWATYNQSDCSELAADLNVTRSGADHEYFFAYDFTPEPGQVCVAVTGTPLGLGMIRLLDVDLAIGSLDENVVLPPDWALDLAEEPFHIPFNPQESVCDDCIGTDDVLNSTRRMCPSINITRYAQPCSHLLQNSCTADCEIRQNPGHLNITSVCILNCKELCHQLCNQTQQQVAHRTVRILYPVTLTEFAPGDIEAFNLAQAPGRPPRRPILCFPHVNAAAIRLTFRDYSGDPLHCSKLFRA